jgi:plasmid stabilization system protein ParE
MSYQILIQPAAFQDIETSYRWMCDNLSPEVANNWYYELQDAISTLQEFPNRCTIAPETAAIGREIRQLW